MTCLKEQIIIIDKSTFMKREILNIILIICLAGNTDLLAQTNGATEAEDRVKVEILMEPVFADSLKLKNQFISSIYYTPGNYLLLATTSDFFLLGKGAVSKLYSNSSNKIGAFTLTPNGALVVVSGMRLCGVDTTGLLHPVYQLPDDGMGVSSGNGVIYTFNKRTVRDKYSLYAYFKDNKYAKIISVDRPINDVLESNNNIIFCSANVIYNIDVKTKALSALYAIQDKNKVIQSLSKDYDRDILYFSTDNEIYRIRNKKIELVYDKIGGTVLYDGDGLVVFNSKHNFVMRMLNNMLY